MMFQSSSEYEMSLCCTDPVVSMAEEPMDKALMPNIAKNVPLDDESKRPLPHSLGHSTAFFGGVLAIDSRRAAMCVVGLLISASVFSTLAASAFLPGAWLLAVVDIVVLTRTVTLNPGIAPKCTAARPSKDDRAAGRDCGYVKIRRLVVPTPYCYTCELVRKPRTSHCAICDNCVHRFDHHCTFIGACIGEGNFGHFYFLVILSAAYSGYIVTVLVWTLWHDWPRQSALFRAIEVMLMLSGGFILINTFAMTITYTHLIWIGHTFRENVKRQALHSPQTAYNPFDNGAWSNCLEMVCYRFTERQYESFDVHESV
jgi:palmitoyltransferase ZDHHC9/14/18